MVPIAQGIFRHIAMMVISKYIPKNVAYSDFIINTEVMHVR